MFRIWYRVVFVALAVPFAVYWVATGQYGWAFIAACAAIAAGDGVIRWYTGTTRLRFRVWHRR